MICTDNGPTANRLGDFASRQLVHDISFRGVPPAPWWLWLWAVQSDGRLVGGMVTVLARHCLAEAQPDRTPNRSPTIGGVFRSRNGDGRTASPIGTGGNGSRETERLTTVMVIDADTDMGPWGAIRQATRTPRVVRDGRSQRQVSQCQNGLQDPCRVDRFRGPSRGCKVWWPIPSHPIHPIPLWHLSVKAAARWTRRQTGMWFIQAKHELRQSVVGEKWGNDLSPSGISRPSVQHLTGLFRSEQA